MVLASAEGPGILAFADTGASPTGTGSPIVELNGVSYPTMTGQFVFLVLPVDPGRRRAQTNVGADSQPGTSLSKPISAS